MAVTLPSRSRGVTQAGLCLGQISRSKIPHNVKASGSRGRIPQYPTQKQNSMIQDHRGSNTCQKSKCQNPKYPGYHTSKKNFMIQNSQDPKQKQNFRIQNPSGSCTKSKTVVYGIPSILYKNYFTIQGPLGSHKPSKLRIKITAKRTSSLGPDPI